MREEPLWCEVWPLTKEGKRMNFLTFGWTDPHHHRQSYAFVSKLSQQGIKVQLSTPPSFSYPQRTLPFNQNLSNWRKTKTQTRLKREKSNFNNTPILTQWGKIWSIHSAFAWHKKHLFARCLPLLRRLSSVKNFFPQASTLTKTANSRLHFGVSNEFCCNERDGTGSSILHRDLTTNSPLFSFNQTTLSSKIYMHLVQCQAWQISVRSIQHPPFSPTLQTSKIKASLGLGYSTQKGEAHTAHLSKKRKNTLLPFPTTREILLARMCQIFRIASHTPTS